VVRLLLIEDDPTIRTPLIRALSERGHAVAAAHTAMGGLQTALDERPDLVVLDLGLPDLDGIRLLRMLRAVSPVPVGEPRPRSPACRLIRPHQSPHPGLSRRSFRPPSAADSTGGRP
jgi:CheY-like chemotaxis protein